MLAGSRGYGPLRSVLVGGVSGRLMHTVHCPVIIVPRGVQAPLAMLFPSRDRRSAAGAVQPASRRWRWCAQRRPRSRRGFDLSVPATSANRSRMPSRPKPDRAFLRVEALAVVAHRHLDVAVAVADADVHAGGLARA